MPATPPRRRRVVRDPQVPEGAPGSLRVTDEPPADTPPRPLRQAEIIRALLARHAAGGEHSTTVELSRNAAGNIQYKVQVRDPDPGTASDKAIELEAALAVLFPPPPPKSPAKE